MAETSLVERSTADYYERALALWPRLDHPHPAWIRHDPHRLAGVIARRTNMSVDSILTLLGVSEADPATGPCRH